MMSGYTPIETVMEIALTAPVPLILLFMVAKIREEKNNEKDNDIKAFMWQCVQLVIAIFLAVAEICIIALQCYLPNADSIIFTWMSNL